MGIERNNVLSLRFLERFSNTLTTMILLIFLRNLLPLFLLIPLVRLHGQNQQDSPPDLLLGNLGTLDENEYSASFNPFEWKPISKNLQNAETNLVFDLDKDLSPEYQIQVLNRLKTCCPKPNPHEFRDFRIQIVSFRIGIGKQF